MCNVLKKTQSFGNVCKQLDKLTKVCVESCFSAVVLTLWVECCIWQTMWGICSLRPLVVENSFTQPVRLATSHRASVALLPGLGRPITTLYLWKESLGVLSTMATGLQRCKTTKAVVQEQQSFQPALEELHLGFGGKGSQFKDVFAFFSWRCSDLSS